MTFPSAPFEEAVLSGLREVKVSEVRGDDEPARKVESLSGRLAEVDSLVKQWTAKMDNPAIVDAVAAKLAELNTKRRALAEQLADAQREAASPLAESWGEFRSLADLLRKDGSDTLRMKVKAALRRSIERAYCLFFGPKRCRLAVVQVQFRGTDLSRTFFVWYRPAVSNRQTVTREADWGSYTLLSTEVKAVDLRDRKAVRFYLDEFLPTFLASRPQFRKVLDAA
jgi:hypothetical protein